MSTNPHIGARPVPGRPPGEALKRLGAHEHAALFFESEEERAELAAGFLQVGMARRERCLHLADEGAAGRILPHLRSAGVDVGQALASGALRLTANRGNPFQAAADPGELVDFLEAAVQEALDDGYGALRVSAEISWAVANAATPDALFELESAWSRLFRERPLVALFQYRRSTCSPGFLAAALRLHPMIVHRGELHPNCLHVAQGAAAPGAEEGDVQHALDAIAGRARAEQAIASSRQRVQHALEGSGQGLWDWDLGTNQIGFSQIWSDVSGLDCSRSVMALADWEQAVHPDDLGPLWESAQAHLTGQTACLEHEHRIRSCSGRWRWVHVRGKAVQRGRSGKPMRLAGTYADVTAARARRDRKAAVDRLADIGTLAAAVAHEINSPLAWITANLGYLKDRLHELEPGAAPNGDLQARLVKVLEESQEGVARITGAVRTLASVTGVDDGSSELADVREPLLDAVALAREEIARRATLSVSVPDALPAVAAHPAVGKVFLSLLLRAASSIPEGRVNDNQVRVTAGEERDGVVVEIADTGSGFGAHLREFAFDPFQSTKNPGHGIRLALPFSRSIVEASGGCLEVASEPRRGTTVRVVLERSRPGAAARGGEPDANTAPRPDRG